MAMHSSAVKPRWTASVRKRLSDSWSRSLQTFRDNSLPKGATNTPSPGRVFKMSPLVGPSGRSGVVA